MAIEIKNLSKAFGNDQIYEQFNTTFETEQITGITGPSGSGKTTLLNLCAGLQVPDSGQITGIDHGKLSYIFQEDRLLPWRTVRENLEFVLKEKDLEKVPEILELVGLSAYAEHYPKALSGGMRQRVSIARAFCYPSEILLMDEPFSSLDTGLKERLMNDFLELWYKDKKTVIFVSHNQQELEHLCHRIIFLSD
ncbi:MAG: ATP-binding cassette domain-containing protein, partial [Eubacterium sp.]